jgi:DNA-binding SARP family transcriptional activator
MPDEHVVKMPLIEISMFGGFSLKIGERSLTDDTGRTKKLWTLLEYLIVSRKKDIPPEKLIEILWEDEGCDNPSNALKNLVYRLRNMLGALCCGENFELIIFKRNVYSWNNELPCKIDAEEFEELYRAAKAGNLTNEEKSTLYWRAIEIYKGDYLPKSSMEDWVIANSTYYKNIFIECVKGICALLRLANKWEEAVLVCEKAISIEPFEESIHELIINAYLVTGERRKAIAHYEYISEMFYEKLGVKLSESLRNLMRSVSKSVSEVEKDLDVIKEDLMEAEMADSAYLCDYEIFKNIYRIEARLAERFGQSVFVALLTIDTNERAKQPVVAATMLKLQTIILGSLRKSDVVSRFSNTQFILMLPTLTFENGQMVLNRIVKKFSEGNKYREIRLSTKLNPLTPLDNTFSRDLSFI